MSYRETKGNLFNSRAKALVNTVNCVGVMGKGIALEFRRRFPGMFQEYQRVCESRQLRPGQILPYRKSEPWVLNFAVKDHWRFPSRLEWVESCLVRFANHYRDLEVTSVALPWLGAMNGGLPWERVQELIRRYLAPLDDIDIELVEFDPESSDPLFERVRFAVTKSTPKEFAAETDLPIRTVRILYEALLDRNVSSISRLCTTPGIGETTIERLYDVFRQARKGAIAGTLFAQ